MVYSRSLCSYGRKPLNPDFYKVLLAYNTGSNPAHGVYPASAK